MIDLKLLAIAPLALAATGCATMREEPPHANVALEKALAGKVAGTPRDCLSLIDTRDSQTYDGTIVYRINRNLSYVNDLNGCTSLGWSSIPVFDIHGSQICRGDIVRIVDRDGGGPRGSCSVGQFVPYTSAR